jgi:hypothetical protein
VKQSIYQHHMRTHHDDFRAPAVIAHFVLVMLPAGMVSIFTVLGTAIVWPPVLAVRGVLTLLGRRRNRPRFRDVVVWEQRCIVALLERTFGTSAPHGLPVAELADSW